MRKAPGETNTVTKFSSCQSMTEIGIGSMLHALHIPLSGHFLSLNQGVILTFAAKSVYDENKSRNQGTRTCFKIASVAAMLKGLSPAGKRMMPMLAIFMQGFFYSLGIALFGLNIFGVAIAMVLLSLWGFVQPLLIAPLLFGTEFFASLQKAWTEIAAFTGISESWGWWLIVTALLIKAILAIGVGVSAWCADSSFEARYFQWATDLQKRWAPKNKRAVTTPLKGALLDLLNPWFLISFAISLAFVFATQSENERWWYLLRTASVSFGLFYLIRVIEARKRIANLNQLADNAD